MCMYSLASKPLETPLGCPCGWYQFTPSLSVCRVCARAIIRSFGPHFDSAFAPTHVEIEACGPPTASLGSEVNQPAHRIPQAPTPMTRRVCVPRQCRAKHGDSAIRTQTHIRTRVGQGAEKLSWLFWDCVPTGGVSCITRCGVIRSS